MADIDPAPSAPVLTPTLAGPRLAVCDAYLEPDSHNERLSTGELAWRPGRRISPMPVVEELRREIRTWRDAGYLGVSAVTRELLLYWFDRRPERESAGTRFFFCQREAIETLLYVYEACDRRPIGQTEGLVRYALKLATGTGKTVVLALVVVWSTLHRALVPGSTLSGNFLVLVPNLTVKDRVGGQSRGDGLDPAGSANLYRAFDMVPPSLQAFFRPHVRVCNWQAVTTDGRREDWIVEDLAAPNRLVPASLQSALLRRARKGSPAWLRRLLGSWRDVIVLDDEAHHAHGARRSTKGGERIDLRWSALLADLALATRLSLVVDVSATPWRQRQEPRTKSTTQAKPDLAFFDWTISDFPVEDAWESRLIKTVCLPWGEVDLHSRIKEARDAVQFSAGCRDPIAQVIRSWSRDHRDWRATRNGPPPVILFITQNSMHARWLFEHLTSTYAELSPPDPADPRSWVTLQVDSSVFDANRDVESLVRQQVATVGRKNEPGEHVRCLIGVQMLSEGWDVQSVTHIVGLRAFDSKLLVEQIVGRGLRRRSYDLLQVPVHEQAAQNDEIVCLMGIPVTGFPLADRRTGALERSRAPNVTIAPDPSKAAYRLVMPNVRGWVPMPETGRLAALHGEPANFDTTRLSPFGWAGLVAAGLKTHWTRVPCRNASEQALAEFLDRAPDVLRYVRNERFGFVIPLAGGGLVRGHPPAYVAQTADGALWALDCTAQPQFEALESWCRRLGMRYGVADQETLQPGECLARLLSF